MYHILYYRNIVFLSGQSGEMVIRAQSDFLASDMGSEAKTYNHTVEVSPATCNYIYMYIHIQFIYFSFNK